MNYDDFEKIIESILFVSGEPVSLNKIAKIIDISEIEVRMIINNLANKLEEEKRGVIIIEIDGAFQMCTNPIYYEHIKNLYKTTPRKILTQSLMETLAIIAYKQPITKSQIEEIRGVNADHSVNKLVEYNLVCEKGRLDAPGRPILFGTTEDFLKYFGYSSLSKLPELNNDFEALKLEVVREIEQEA